MRKIYLFVSSLVAMGCVSNLQNALASAPLPRVAFSCERICGLHGTDCNSSISNLRFAGSESSPIVFQGYRLDLNRSTGRVSLEALQARSRRTLGHINLTEVRCGYPAVEQLLTIQPAPGVTYDSSQSRMCLGSEGLSCNRGAAGPVSGTLVYSQSTGRFSFGDGTAPLTTTSFRPLSHVRSCHLSLGFRVIPRCSGVE